MVENVRYPINIDKNNHIRIIGLARKGEEKEMGKTKQWKIS